ncbi:MAG TPA: HEAT repeat domain-containing protein, partial [Daejeonella sp.]|nr:HEAT repeat domain-containing protein [Daejeonella sp.]
ACLRHNNPIVRQHAIKVLKNLPSEHSASILIDIYFSETANNQLAILHALESVSTDAEIPFLLSLLAEDVIAIKMASAKALASLGQSGIEAIQSHSASKEYPLAQILAQILEEAE